MTVLELLHADGFTVSVDSVAYGTIVRQMNNAKLLFTGDASLERVSFCNVGLGMWSKLQLVTSR